MIKKQMTITSNVSRKFVTLMTILILVLIFPKQTSAATPYTIEYGNIETVYDWQKDHCADGGLDIPDMATRALVDSNGNVQLYSTVERKFIGNNLTDIKHDCHFIMDSHKNPNPRAYDDYEWLASPYTFDGNTIYGLVHTEYHGWEHNNCNTTDSTNWIQCWWNSINLAKSTDSGNTFTHLTPPNQNVANLTKDYDPNNKVGNLGIFAPSNIIKKDNYYYAKVSIHIQPTPLINGKSTIPGVGVCLMRTNDLNDPNSWRFWDGTGFNSPTKNFPAAGNCEDIYARENYWEMHWSTYLNTYISLGSQSPGTTPQLITQQSDDLVHLSGSDYLLDHPIPNSNSYHTFLQPGAETRNFEDIGRSPWMYFVTCVGDQNCTSRNLKRIRVRFNKPEGIGKYDVVDLHFNEYKGAKTLDSSFYGNDGTLTGDMAFKQDGDTKYVHLGGTGDIKVNPNTSLNLSNQITITTRLRTTQKPATNSFSALMVKQDENNKRNYGIFLNSSGQVAFQVMNGSEYVKATSNLAVNDGNWHKIQINFNSSTGLVQIVIDDKLDSQSTISGKLADGVNNGPLYIGSSNFASNFSGDLDSLTIYNYLLPAPNQSSSIPGDFNNDSRVNSADYDLLVSKFNNPYTIFDYNNLVSNYGK